MHTNMYIYKTTNEIHTFKIGGGLVPAFASDGFEFSATYFNTISILGDLQPSTQTLQIAAYDGTSWSEWKSLP